MNPSAIESLLQHCAYDKSRRRRAGRRGSSAPSRWAKWPSTVIIAEFSFIETQLSR